MALAIPGTGAANNLATVIVLLNREVNASLGIGNDQRQELSLDQIEEAMASLESLSDRVRAQIAEALG